MRSFLERIGYGSGGIHYFIRPGSGFIAKLFGGAAWGTFSAFDKEFFFSVNNVVWRVPYLSVKNVNIEGGQGLKRFIKQTSVVIDFIYQNKIKKYHVSVPGIGMGLSIPIESKIDTQATENLFKILKEKIR
ncbi:hypothetical protein ISS85_01850 [Candidatus Microgenomates bacterium]|nr:hypothetical protein [Candidatus Microgenomates bacterium]